MNRLAHATLLRSLNYSFIATLFIVILFQTQSSCEKQDEQRLPGECGLAGQTVECNNDYDCYNTELGTLCNPEGNVLALMPHPERAAWLRQVPGGMQGIWSERRVAARGQWAMMEEEGPGRMFFQAFRSNG